MNYIYDLIINFFEENFDFYEWDKTDNYTHFKKIPIIKINKKDYKNIINNKIIINKQLLQNIKNKSEIYNDKSKNIHYLLLTNGTDIIALKFNKDGVNIERSSLSVEDELDILIIAKKIKNTEINYKVINKINTIFKTRKEKEINEYLNKELNKLSTKKDTNKIKYLYYECFNEIENNSTIALNNLLKNINNSYITNKLYKYLKLCKTSNK